MATRKQKQKRMKSVKNRTPTPYPRISQQTHQSYTNISETWVNGQGRRNVVTIRNGKGQKRVERMGPRGEVLDTTTRSLSPPERNQILRGKFVPGLWRNCRLGSC